MMKAVSQCMSSPVIFVRHDMNLHDAAKYMFGKGIHSLLVKNANKYVGIITDTDFYGGIIGQGLDPKTTPVSTMMSSPIATVDYDYGMDRAREMLQKHHTKHLAVTRDGEIMGMLSLQDILN